MSISAKALASLRNKYPALVKDWSGVIKHAQTQEHAELAAAERETLIQQLGQYLHPTGELTFDPEKTLTALAAKPVDKYCFNRLWDNDGPVVLAHLDHIRVKLGKKEELFDPRIGANLIARGHGGWVLPKLKNFGAVNDRSDVDECMELCAKATNKVDRAKGIAFIVAKTIPSLELWRPCATFFPEGLEYLPDPKPDKLVSAWIKTLHGMVNILSNREKTENVPHVATKVVPALERLWSLLAPSLKKPKPLMSQTPSRDELLELAEMGHLVHYLMTKHPGRGEEQNVCVTALWEKVVKDVQADSLPAIWDLVVSSDNMQKFAPILPLEGLVERSKLNEKQWRELEGRFFNRDTGAHALHFLTEYLKVGGDAPPASILGKIVDQEADNSELVLTCLAQYIKRGFPLDAPVKSYRNDGILLSSLSEGHARLLADYACLPPLQLEETLPVLTTREIDLV